MAIVKRPKQHLTDVTKSDPMAFIQEADHRQMESVVEPEHKPVRPKRKEPVIIRFDSDTLEQVDQAAAKRGLSRAALVRMLVIENLPD
jgi:predicted DNA binding CopG/RHH family protein